MSEKGQAWKARARSRREQDAQPSTPSVTESAERILAYDGTATAGDARVCAEFVLAVQQRFKERVEDARVVLGQGPDEAVRWLSGESRPAREPDVSERGSGALPPDLCIAESGLAPRSETSDPAKERL